MPTTPNGTVYTVHTFTSSAGETAYRAIADNRVNARRIPTLLFVHGNPGSVPTAGDQQFTNGYAEVRNWIIDNGWAYIEGHGAGANWGNDAGRAAYEAMYADTEAVWNLGRTIVVGRSMGALLASWLASESPVVSRKAAGFISLSGTADLTARYSTANTVDRDNMNAAWGVTNEAEWRAAVRRSDPLLRLQRVWDGRNAQMQWASGDTTVPPAINGQAWDTKYGPRLALRRTIITEGGDHNSVSNDPDQIAATIAFLQDAQLAPGIWSDTWSDIWGGEPPHGGVAAGAWGVSGTASGEYDPTSGPWLLSRMNLFHDPFSVSSNTDAWDGLGHTLTREDGAAFGQAYVTRFTRVGAGTGSMVVSFKFPLLMMGQTYTLRIRTRGSSSGAWTVATRMGTVSVDTLTSVASGSSPGEYVVTFTPTANVDNILLRNSARPPGAWLEITDVTIVSGTSLGGPTFSGDSPSSQTRRYRWVGAPNLSESIEETRVLAASGSWTFGGTGSGKRPSGASGSWAFGGAAEGKRIPTSGPWQDSRRNGALNPDAQNGGSLVDAGGQRWSWARTLSFSEGTPPLPHVTSWGRHRATSTVASANTRGVDFYGNRDAAFNQLSTEQPVRAGVPTTVSIYTRAYIETFPAGPVMQMQLRVHNGTSWVTPIQYGVTVDAPRGQWVRVWITVVPPADGFISARLAISGSFSQTVNDTIEYWGLLVEDADTMLPAFTGSSPDTFENNYIWSGEPNSSPSYEQVRPLAALGTWTFGGNASGGLMAEGSASGTWVFAGEASSTSIRRGSATGEFEFGGSASGETETFGVAVGAWIADGYAEGGIVHDGSASGQYTFTGSAEGKAVSAGVAEGSWTFVGSATSESERDGSASGTWVFTGFAEGKNNELGEGIACCLTLSAMTPILTLEGWCAS